MRVFGIDPGCTVTGFGVVESHRGRVTLVDAGCIRTKASEPMTTRLHRIYRGLVDALERNNPDTVGIEAIFHHKNAQSALILGQARGVALLATAKFGFEPAEYNPMVVKRSVGAHGRADKKALAKMVCMLLGTQVEGPSDVTDALAIAITHAAHYRAQAIVGVR
ncbi:MAG: crossover junction endodeoxyribonuclease RuvC [Myxococcota bacterium]|jgi:crossover junction endodeoxyribonuclease RuvC